MKRTYILLILCLVGLSLRAANDLSLSVSRLGADRWTLDVLLNNAQKEYCAFQMDLVLPEGFVYEEGSLKTTSRTEGFLLQSTVLPSGNLRVMGYSPAQLAIVDADAPLVDMVLIAPQGLEEGEFGVTVKNVRFSDSKGTESVLPGSTCSFTVTDISDVAGIKGVNNAGIIYTLGGARCNKDTKGLVIVNGKKVLRK